MEKVLNYRLEILNTTENVFEIEEKINAGQVLCTSVRNLIV